MKYRVFSVLMLLLLARGAPAAPDEHIVSDWALQDKKDPASVDVKACEARRAERLEPLLAKYKKIVFTKHYDMGGSHYAYTEGQSDAQAERHFRPGTALCVLNMDGIYGKVETLIEDPKGVIRDPDVSYDGKRILFSWKKSDRKDDYHLYEMDYETKKVRRLTDGLGFADYEGAYLPDGNIVFNSTRCVQIVDCWWTEVSNLYICDRDGRYMRRVGFDQVHTNYPQVMDDGRVIYTRWDYNDRGQLFPQPLFQMNIDGTAQTEFYGNNSWFPTTIMHARGIPGTGKVLAVFSGHHTRQKGKLGIIDPSKGRQEAEGAKLIAPVRETKSVRIDKYGQKGEQFQYPYPIDEKNYIVTYNPVDKKSKARRFAIYFMDIEGNRELLAWDDRISCNQPVPLAPRRKPPVRPSSVDYTGKTGTYYVQDVYLGPGLKGIDRGVVKKLRVVALEFRAAGVGRNGNGGPAGGALVSTPVAIRNGSWDVKSILGDTPVYEDGSAMFVVPARTPLYFQLLDEKNHVVQSMRSWSTLQPGEKFSCFGCHEDKNEVFNTRSNSMAMKAGPGPLDPFHGAARGFSFIKEIQPILDRHCIKCHNDRSRQLGAKGGGKARGKIPSRASHVQGDIGALSDGRMPRNSNDHSIPRFTWWARKGSREWVQYDFKDARSVTGVDVYWFDDEPRGGCRVPRSWKLLYRDGKAWKPVRGVSNYPTTKDCMVSVEFPAVTTNGLRIEVKLKKGFSGGILEWKVVGGKAAAAVKKPEPKPAAGVKKAFSLLGEGNPDRRAGRNWSDAYLNLTQRGRPNEIVNWLNVQSIPPMLPPYFAGACKSRLIAVHEKGHNNVKLSREEMDKLAAWIDLNVPFCGDYYEANTWDEKGKAKYDRFQKKREAMEAIERRNIQALIRASR